MSEISFRSPFSPEECARRLEAATQPDRGDWYEDLNRTHAVLARLKGQRVRLRVRRPYTRNALAPLFYGRFEAILGGTLLRGRFRTHPGILAFVIVWFTGILLMGGWIFALSLRSLQTQIAILPLTIGSAALLWFLRRVGRAEREDILHMIRHTLNATIERTNSSDHVHYSIPRSGPRPRLGNSHRR